MTNYKTWKLVNLLIATFSCGILMILSFKLRIHYIDIPLTFFSINIAIIISQLIVFGMPLLIYKSINEYFNQKYPTTPSIQKENISLLDDLKDLFSSNWIKSIVITLIISTATILLMYTFRNLVYNIQYYLNIIPDGLLEAFNHDEATTLTVQQFLITVISIVIVTSILEEMFFRGIIIKSYNYLPVWLIIFFSTICFIIAHDSYSQMVLVIPLSFVCVMIFLKTNNIVHPIFVHACANLFAIINFRIDKKLFTAEYPVKYGEKQIALSNSFFCFTIIIVLIITIIFLIKKIENIDAQKTNNLKQEENSDSIIAQHKSNVKELISFGSICIGFCLIIWIRFNLN